MDQCFVHSLFRSKAKVCLLPFQALDYHLKEEEKNVFKIKFLAVNPTTFVCRHDPNVLEVWNFISVEKWSKPLVPIELVRLSFRIKKGVLTAFNEENTCWFKSKADVMQG